MAKQKPTEQQPEDQKPEAGPAVFVLNKSFGALVGRRHAFWPAGTEFVAGKDDATISLLARAGADLTQK